MGAGMVAIPDEMLMISPFCLSQDETQLPHFFPKVSLLIVQTKCNKMLTAGAPALHGGEDDFTHLGGKK